MKLLRLAALALLSPAAALAHDTWLLVPAPALQPGQEVVLQLTSGMAFPAPETTIKTDRIVTAAMRVGGTKTSLTALREDKAFLALTAKPASAGVMTVWFDTKDRSLTIDEEADVAHYLDETGLSATVGKQWTSGGKKPWRETYAKHAKAFVRVGDGAGDRSWAEPSGQALDLVPESDPTALKAGDTLTVRLLREGKPVTGHPVAAVAGGRTDATLKTTGDDGRVTFTLDRPGPWMLRTTVIDPVAGDPGAWRSHFATATLHVGGR